jgi:hypothetical protein
MLEDRDVFAPGVGLGAFKLILFGREGSAEALPEAVVNMLLGRPDFLAGAAAGFDTGGGGASTVTVTGRTNMPRPMRQSK